MIDDLTRPEKLGFSASLRLPPSTNNLFKNVGKRGRAKTGPYVDWLAEAGAALRQLRVEPIGGRFSLDITVPAAMRGDISNRVKAIEDLLVAEKLTPDDRYCDDLRVRRCEMQPVGVVAIHVRSISPALTSVGDGPRPVPARRSAGAG